MILYAIIENGTDKSNFWSPYTKIYRICSSLESAKDLLSKMAELCTNLYRPNDYGFYSEPKLKNDGKELSLFHRSTARYNGYDDWILEFKIVQIDDVSSLFSDKPF